MIRRYRWTLVIGALFVLWLAFGAQLIDDVLHESPSPPPVTGTITPDLGLTGTLFYTQGDAGITRIDLAAGTVQQWWSGDAPAHGLATTGSGQLVVAVGGSLYLTNTESPDLRLLLDHDTAYFDHPFVAGEWVYFTRYDRPRTRDLLEPGWMMSVERLRLDDAASVPEVVIENAEQPAVRADQLAYIAYDPATGAQSLWIADLEGETPRELVNPTAFDALLAPRFYDDSLIFGASGRLSTGAASIAHAHGPPWGVWTVPLAGGIPDEVLLLSFDGPWVATADGGEFFVLDAEGVYWVGAVRIERLANSDHEGALIYLSEIR